MRLEKICRKCELRGQHCFIQAIKRDKNGKVKEYYCEFPQDLTYLWRPSAEEIKTKVMKKGKKK